MPDPNFAPFDESEFHEDRPEGNSAYDSPLPNITNPAVTSSNVQEPTLPAHVRALQAIIANPATKDKEFATLIQGCVIPELKPQFSALRSHQLRESTMAAHVLLTNHLDSVLQLQEHQESILAFARKDIAESANARKRAADAERALNDAQKIIKAREVELKTRCHREWLTLISEASRKGLVGEEELQ
ncbi:uncharacterized protein [Rutidosis leptorrhynchoides]|uniref:uncharacterized protein n=1 Tax=Rutidosis leptorrhynchoides TaxID=125765 RepID=UPI003A99F7AD